MKTILPEWIFVEKDDRFRYKDIENKLGRKFHHVDVFNLAMIYGYMNHVRVPLTRKEGLFRTISAGDNFFSLMVMLYFNELNRIPKNMDDISEACSIAQEYANGGLKFLEKDIFNDFDNFTNKLAHKLLKFHSNPEFSENLRKFGGD